MSRDKVEYSHPELLPYSDGSNSEVLFSVVIGAVFAAVLLVAVLG